MLVKAKQDITIYRIVEVEDITRYYMLSKDWPDKPTTNPPSGWSDTEPSYTSGSTNTLYFCDLTVLSDGTWAYSNVSKSSSYEAAKEAYNKAQNAQNAINNLEIGGRNLLLKSNTLYTNKSYNTADYYFGDEKPIEGETYTLTIKGKLGEGKTCFSAYNSGGSINFGRLAAGDNGIHTFTGKWYITQGRYTANNTFLSIYALYASVTVTSTIEWIKLEKGNKATGWTPAPEDLAIADDVEKIETRVTTAETEIDKNTEQIALRATKTEVTEVKNQIVSRGENLVTNGTAMLGDNTNFSDFTYDGADTYYSGGSFKYSWTGAVEYRLRGIDELMPVNVSNAYELSYWIKANNADISFYDMLIMYDIDKNIIDAENVMWIDGSTTTLAQELKNGDTVVHLTSVAGFNTTTTHSYERGLIFWNYTNSKGHTYPTETYSRNRWKSLWSSGSAINTTNNTITLSSAWTHGTFPAGTSVSQCSSGATYTYLNGNFKLPVNTWTYKSGTARGIGKNNEPNKFREGTAFINIRWMVWYGGTASCEFRLSNVSLTTNAGINELEELRTETATENKTVTDRISAIETNTKSINLSVSNLMTKVNENADDVGERLQSLEQKVDLQLTEDAVNIQIDNKLQNGVNKVETSTGFRFDEDGLNISKVNASTSTQITENGMTVQSTEVEGSEGQMLKADKDGVNAKNLRATTYLIVGGRSRFENYPTNRTACFWIGE